MSGGNTHEAAAAADRFAAAHAALKADSSVQFTMPPAPQPPPPPQWLIDFGHWIGRMLRPIGRFFHWIGSFMPDAPYARIFLWTVLAVAAVLLLWLVYQRLRHGEWRLPRRRTARTAAVETVDEGWVPDAAPVRAWLREADALAEQGRFDEAVHHLLFRSIEDIAKRRPRLVRPALTSRELAAADAIPGPARDLFASIARLVERSLFGGRPVDAGDWASARGAYADFTLPGTWRA
ncbi:hypothetical protein GCM10009087_38420 [Sphingomonas oligophenolica]|uniref:DUF4129 domain-containing protein n=1 Tax=Sphingomonas oligophenolica TaxID=301154 RepID=A0ABU9Y4U7_9SPHN